MLAAATLALAAASATTRAWRDGPVRYLLTDDERRAFGELPNDAARGAFVERFWKGLDPDASTEANEFRATFESRCLDADRRFESIGGAGWASDRGRVYILLGEPTTIRRETGGLLAVEREVWTYDAGDGSEVARIDFYRCPSGEHRLDPACPAPGLVSAAADWDRANALRWARASDPAVLRQRLRYLASTFLAPPVIESLPAHGDEAAPAATEARPDVVRSTRLADEGYFFRAQDGSVLTFLLLELANPPGEPAAAASELLAAATVDGRTQLLDRIEGPDGMEAFFGRVHLRSGTASAARFTLKDGRREEILVRERRLTAPDFSGFSASSVVPAERFGPAEPGVPGAFVVGSEEVVPRAGSTFRRGELLRLYLQVYGAAVDPATGMPRVDVAFRFIREGRRLPKATRAPLRIRGATGASMGLALPVGDWPPGEYRVEVELRDRVGGARTLVDGAFRLAADPPQEPAR